MLSIETSKAAPARRLHAAIKSPLRGVSDSAWGRFVKAIEGPSVKAVSESGGFGLYDIRPRRLVELGCATNLRYLYKQGGRSIQACDFKGPWTKDRFLADLATQYNVFRRSMELYHADLTSGAIKKPDSVSLSGALAILHRGGKGALAAWPGLFEHTRALYEAAQGAF